MYDDIDSVYTCKYSQCIRYYDISNRHCDYHEIYEKYQILDISESGIPMSKSRTNDHHKFKRFLYQSKDILNSTQTMGFIYIIYYNM